MIKSIEFTGKGYISKKESYVIPRKGVTQEEFERVAKLSHQRGPEWDKVARNSKPHYVNKHLRKTFVGCPIEFEADKINVIFGPNGSGKTTILKAIGAYALCGDENNLDGLTNVMSLSPRLSFGFDESEKSQVEKLIIRRAGNEAVLDWDGSMVYYENFKGRKQYGTLGDNVGSILQDGKEEFLYLINKKEMSSGQNSMYILNKVLPVLSSIKSKHEYVEYMKKYIDKIGWANDTWKDCWRENINYLEGCMKDNDTDMPTLLLDEIDSSMDIYNTIDLYKYFMPLLKEKYNIQIILVSHSPVIMSDYIYNNENYNIISLDKKYTKECREKLKSLWNY